MTLSSLFRRSRRTHPAHLEHIWEIGVAASQITMGGSLLMAIAAVATMHRFAASVTFIHCGYALGFLLLGIVSWRMPHRNAALVTLIVGVHALFLTNHYEAYSPINLSIVWLLPGSIAIAWQCGWRTITVYSVGLLATIWGTDGALDFRDHTSAEQLVAFTANYLVSVVLVHLIARRVRRAIRTMNHMAVTDYLTGLPNRRHMMDRLAGPWVQARGNTPFLAALVIDLDNFKQINDLYGHFVGDEVLQQAADRVRCVVRETDIVARTGGEEIVVIGHVENESAAKGLAERLRLSIASGVTRVPVTASIGASAVDVTAPGFSSEDVYQLLDRADEAMYLAKDGGRDCTVLKPFRADATDDAPDTGRRSGRGAEVLLDASRANF